jgi:hypothetical protein
MYEIFFCSRLSERHCAERRKKRKNSELESRGKYFFTLCHLREFHGFTGAFTQFVSLSWT